MSSPADVSAHVLIALVLIIVAAQLVGRLFERFGQPRVVGEMIAGILIGPTVIGGSVATASSGPTGTGLTDALYPAESFAFLTMFGTIAMVLFMFLIGLEIPRQMLRARARSSVMIGTAVLVASIGMGVALAMMLDTPGLWRVEELPDGRPAPLIAHALLLSSGLSATALPIIARVLQDRGQINTPVGVVSIGATAWLIPTTFLMVDAGAMPQTGYGPIGSIGIRLAMAAALVAALRFCARPLLARALARHRGPGLADGMFVMLLCGVMLTALAADRIGIQALAGGLLFGLTVPPVPGLAQAITARLRQSVVVLGLPVFLAASGLQTDLRLVRLEHLGAITLVLCAIAICKWGVGTAAGRAAGLSTRDAKAVGGLLSCGGLITLSVASTASQLGLITPSMKIVFVVAAILTTMTTGPLLNRILGRPPAQ